MKYVLFSKVSTFKVGCGSVFTIHVSVGARSIVNPVYLCSIVVLFVFESGNQLRIRAEP